MKKSLGGHSGTRREGVSDCPSCGAILHYQPGTASLNCAYCGKRVDIAAVQPGSIQELDLAVYLRLDDRLLAQTKVTVCHNCSAQVVHEGQLKSSVCPYCHTSLIEADSHDERLVRPSYILPFAIASEDAGVYFRKWIRKRWFAPGKLKEMARREDKLCGVYLPFWTYDAQTVTRYSGQRGMRTTVTTGSGENKKTVIRLDWYPCNGVVRRSFDDILIRASATMPEKVGRQIGSWDMRNLAEVDTRFMSGFVTEKYTIGYREGFDRASAVIRSSIESSIRSDIGGHEQKIDSYKTDFSGLKFKLILLPLYISSYTFGKKSYRYYINGRTGAVYGDRPYSAGKIALFVLFLLILLIVLIASQVNQL